MNNLENSMYVGAQDAYDRMGDDDGSMLTDAVIQLEVALQARELPPIIKHARTHIMDCALDEYDVIESALMQSLTDPAEAGQIITRLMDKHLRNYAEGHLSTLKEFFRLGQYEPEPDHEQAA